MFFFFLLPPSRFSDRFFRLVCSEYFRPGSFPPADDQETHETIPNGTIGGGVGAAEGGDSGEGVAGGEGRAVLRRAMLRADYVNSLNAFNQLPVSMEEHC